MVARLLTLPDITDAEVDRIFQALADATRRDIVRRVLQKEQSVSELADRYAMSFAAVQKHVAVLERACLVHKERRGREQLVHGNPDRLRQATRLLDQFEQLWLQRVRSIDRILADDPPAAARPTNTQ
jgi:DNA-binding transcriptional ArsR family regulator